MTNKDITLYGAERGLELAEAAIARLKQEGYSFPDNPEAIPIFRAGFVAALDAMEIEKKRKAANKEKRFDIADFIDLRTYKANPGYHGYAQGVFYDAEEKTAVVTNGQLLVYAGCDIPEGYENKVVDKNGVFCDVRFPNWKRVVPDNSDIVEIDRAAFIHSIEKTDLNMNMTAAAAYKSTNWYKIGEFIFSARNIKWIKIFLDRQKESKVYMYKEGSEHSLKNEKAVTIKGDNATMVIMPGRMSATSSDCIIEYK